MHRSTGFVELPEQFDKADKLEATIKKNLEALGYEE